MTMMDWLGGWVNQIIILVLVATFIHLLLPNNALERYVKLVMGLLIILAILSPLFQFLKKDINLSELAFAPGGSMQTMEPIEQINGASKQLQQQQYQLIEQQTERAIEQTIKLQVAQKFGVEVMQAKVMTQGDSAQATQIKQVQVVVQEGASSSDDSTDPIQPVQPVEIHVGDSQPVLAQPTATNQELTNHIMTYIEQMWSLSPEQVHVQLVSAS